MRIIGLLGGFVVGVVGVLPAWGQAFVLRHADLSTRMVNVHSLDERQLVYAPVSGQRSFSAKVTEGAPASLPADLVLSLMGEGDGGAAVRGPVLYLADGQRLAGTLVGLSGDKLVVRSGVLGEVSVPLDECVGLVMGGGERVEGFGGVGSAAVGSSGAGTSGGASDRVVLQNGDVVTGAISAVTALAVTVVSDGGQAELPVDAITLVEFARLGGDGERKGVGAETGWRLDLVDGSVLRVGRMMIAGGKLTLQLAASGWRPGEDGVVRLNVGQMRRAENFGGNTLFATATAGIVVRGMPMVQGTPMVGTELSGGRPELIGGWVPARVRVAGSEYTRVVAMRPRSEVTMVVPAGYKQLRFGAALGGDALQHPWADAEVRVVQGEKELLRQRLTGAGAVVTGLGVAVEAGEVRVVVMEGANLAVTDEVMILEPVFMR